jgi:heptosyltransferase III
MNVDATVAAEPLVRDGRASPRAGDRPGLTATAHGGLLPWDGIRRILLCRPNRRLGNLLFLTPLLAEIEARHPGTIVDIVGAGAGVGGLFSGYGIVGTVFELPRNPFHAPGQLARGVRAFWRERYDLVIDPERRSRSARFFANCCRAKYRLGFSADRARSRLTHSVPIEASPQHMSRRAVYLLRCASDGPASDPAAAYPELDLRLRPDERASGAALVARTLREHGTQPAEPVITLFANATGAKRYPVDWWRRLTAGLRVLLPRARFLEILPPGGERPSELGLPSFRSSDLRQVASVIHSTAGFVSADCGTLHLACASGAPCVIGLFSATDPAVYGPVGARRYSIVTLGQTPEDVARKIGETFGRGLDDQSLRLRSRGPANLSRAS